MGRPDPRQCPPSFVLSSDSITRTTTPQSHLGRSIGSIRHLFTPPSVPPHKSAVHFNLPSLLDQIHPVGSDLSYFDADPPSSTPLLHPVPDLDQLPISRHKHSKFYGSSSGCNQFHYALLASFLRLGQTFRAFVPSSSPPLLLGIGIVPAGTP